MAASWTRGVKAASLRTSELELLCASLRSAIGRGREGELEALAQNQTQWISFLTLSLDHHVAGIAFAGLSALPDGVVPEPVLRQLAQHSRRIMQHRAAGIAETRRIATALAQEGVPVIPIKGPCLRERVFGRIAAGPSGDLDLLLRKDQEPKALRIIAECGYASAARFTPRQGRALMSLRGQDVMLHRDKRFILEPHRALAPSNFGVRIDHEGLWQRARPLRHGEPFLVLSPEDEFILLALHGCKEEWTRLKWVADLAAFLVRYPELDWDLVRNRALHQLMSKRIGLAMLLVDQLFVRETPRIAMARQRQKLCPLADQVVSRWAKVRAASSAFELSSVQWALCDNAAARLSYVLRTMMTPRAIHFRMVRLPDWAFPGYYAIKLLHDYGLWPIWALMKRVSFAVGRVKSSLFV
jgi:Uncharacterised nucleotidyltransferase